MRGEREAGAVSAGVRSPGWVRDDVGTRALRGSAVGLINVGLGIGTTLATVPLVLRGWTQARYAEWLAVFAVYSLLQTVDTGHTGYLGNEFLRLTHGDRDEYRRVYASGVRVSLLLGAGQLVVAAALYVFGLLPRVLGLPLAGSAAADTGVALLALSLGWWASGSFGAIIAGLYFPSGEFVRAQWWAIANRLLLFACLVIPALAGGGVLGAAVATGAGNVLFTVALLADAWRRIPLAREWRRHASWGEGMRNVRRSLIVTANNASGQVGTSGVALAVAALFGAAALPVFTTLRTLANAAAAVTTVAVSPIVPDMVRYRVRGEWAKLRASFEACWLGAGAVVHVGFVASFPLAELLYTGWTRGRIAFDAPLYAMLAWGIGVAALGSPALRYLQAMNRLGAQTACNTAYLGVLAAAVPPAVAALGLAGVGVALAAAEVTRTMIAVGQIAREAGPVEGAGVVRSAMYATIPLAVAGAGLALGAAVPAHRTLVSASALALLLPTLALQWRALEPDLRDRIGRVLPWNARLGPV